MTQKHTATMKLHGARIPAAEDMPQAELEACLAGSAMARPLTGRRCFLAQLAGLAAATALGTKRTAGAAEVSPPAGPLPTIQLGQHRISRLVAGSNPISGYSYLGPHTDRQHRVNREDPFGITP